MPQPILEGMLEVKSAVEDLHRGRYESADHTLRRIVAQFEPETPLGRIATEQLPAVDFEAWWAAGLQTGGSMVGSSELEWPIDTKERLAYYIRLFRFLTLGQRGILHYCQQFLYSGSTHTENIRGFAEEVVAPFYRDWTRLVTPALEAEELAANTPVPRSPLVAPTGEGSFVDPARISDLESLSSQDFDFSRLVRMCYELNVTWGNGALLSTAMLTRALIDHVPPLFGFSTFSEVANNHTGRSFRESMTHLSNSARKISDSHLHVQIRKQESLPTPTQVDFSRDLDVLLAEIVRLFRQ